MRLLLPLAALVALALLLTAVAGATDLPAALDTLEAALTTAATS